MAVASGPAGPVLAGPVFITRTSARAQQQAVSPIQRHRMISQNGTLASELKGFPKRTHLGKRKLCPRFNQWQIMATLCA